MSGGMSVFERNNCYFVCRPKRHFREPVSNGQICNGGTGFPAYPVASLHRTHGCSSLQAATTPWWRNLYEGEYVYNLFL